MNRRPGSRTRSFLELASEELHPKDINPYRKVHLEEPGVIPATQGPGYKGRWSEEIGRAHV